MLKHLYVYQDFRVLLLTSAGEILSGEEYVIAGLEELMEERLGCNDEAFILDETLVNTQTIPDLRDWGGGGSGKSKKFQKGNSTLDSNTSTESMGARNYHLKNKRGELNIEPIIYRTMMGKTKAERDVVNAFIAERNQRMRKGWSKENNNRKPGLNSSGSTFSNSVGSSNLNSYSWQNQSQNGGPGGAGTKNSLDPYGKTQFNKIVGTTTEKAMNQSIVELTQGVTGQDDHHDHQDHSHDGETEGGGSGGGLAQPGTAAAAASLDPRIRLLERKRQKYIRDLWHLDNYDSKVTGGTSNANAQINPDKLTQANLKKKNTQQTPKQIAKQNLQRAMTQKTLLQIQSDLHAKARNLDKLSGLVPEDEFDNPQDVALDKVAVLAGQQPGQKTTKQLQNLHKKQQQLIRLKRQQKELQQSSPNITSPIYQSPQASPDNSPVGSPQQHVAFQSTSLEADHHNQSEQQSESQREQRQQQSQLQKYPGFHHGVHSDQEFLQSDLFKNRNTRWKRYLRETYVDQVLKSRDLMSKFFLTRMVQPNHIYKYDFSDTSDEHPQDVLDQFLQIPGKRIIYYAGHTTLDGGWYFSWRNSLGIPDSWIIRPSDFEYGPRGKEGCPLLIVDGSYTDCWLEPSCKFITIACYEKEACGGGRRGSYLSRTLSGFDCDSELFTRDGEEVRLEMAIKEKLKDPRSGFMDMITGGNNNHNQANSSGQIAITGQQFNMLANALTTLQDKGMSNSAKQARGFWSDLVKNKDLNLNGDSQQQLLYYDNDKYIIPPHGCKLRLRENYLDDSQVLRLPLYLPLFNEPTNDSVWSLRAVLESATFKEKEKVRVYGILPLMLKILTGEQISKGNVSAFSIDPQRVSTLNPLAIAGNMDLNDENVPVQHTVTGTSTLSLDSSPKQKKFGGGVGGVQQYKQTNQQMDHPKVFTEADGIHVRDPKLREERPMALKFQLEQSQQRLNTNTNDPGPMQQQVQLSPRNVEVPSKPFHSDEMITVGETKIHYEHKTGEERSLAAVQNLGANGVGVGEIFDPTKASSPRSPRPNDSTDTNQNIQNSTQKNLTIPSPVPNNNQNLIAPDHPSPYNNTVTVNEESYYDQYDDDDEFFQLDPTSEYARMLEEACRVIGLMAPVLRMDEISHQALPVVTQYTINTDNYCGWKTIGQLGESYKNSDEMRHSGMGSKGQDMQIVTPISKRCWNKDLHNPQKPEVKLAKLDAVSKCGAALVNVERERLIEDCRSNLDALVRLNASLPRECRLENLEEARPGLRLLAEGQIVNPKLIYRTLMRFPFDSECLRWGLKALSRGGFKDQLDINTLYIPVMTAFTLQSSNTSKRLDDMMQSASDCFRKLMQEDCWKCNIWDTMQSLLTIINRDVRYSPFGYADVVMQALLTACASMERRSAEDIDGEPPSTFRWRPLLEAVLDPNKVVTQKTLDTAFSCYTFIVRFEAANGRENHTNLNSTALDLANRWKEIIARIKVVELMPGLNFLSSKMKPLFLQKDEILRRLKAEKEAAELAEQEKKSGKRKTRKTEMGGDGDKDGDKKNKKDKKKKDKYDDMDDLDVD